MQSHLIGNHSGQTEALAIIPARGGSKGIPHKNIHPLCGKPLIAYSIETALAASSIDRWWFPLMTKILPLSPGNMVLKCRICVPKPWRLILLKYLAV